MLIDREALLDLHLSMRGKIRDAATMGADNPDRLSDVVWAARQARFAGILDGLALAEQALRGMKAAPDTSAPAPAVPGAPGAAE